MRGLDKRNKQGPTLFQGGLRSAGLSFQLLHYSIYFNGDVQKKFMSIKQRHSREG